MRSTRHFGQRRSQRGVSQAMVDLTIAYGSIDQDKHILGRKEALERLACLKQEQQILKKIVDKGGLVVVVEGGDLITTYNRDQRCRKLTRPA
jgi:hypothetical protein